MGVNNEIMHLIRTIYGYYYVWLNNNFKKLLVIIDIFNFYYSKYLFNKNIVFISYIICYSI